MPKTLAVSERPGRGFVLKSDGDTTTLVSLNFDRAGRVTDIYIVRNPEKLEDLRAVVIH